MRVDRNEVETTDCNSKEISMLTHRTQFRSTNSSKSERNSRQDDELASNFKLNNASQMICGLKQSISLSWLSFLNDVRFGLNYTTFRSIFSEIIPSLLVIFFNIGIIICVIKATLSFSANNPSVNTRQNPNGSFQTKEAADGLIVHNRPRTSWMNIVLIIHSCLFFFSSLTATIVHWSTSDALLSYWTSVVILANCSLNFYVYCLSGKSFRSEIKKLLSDYFQFYFCVKFLNLFRTTSQRQRYQERVRMRLVQHRTANLLLQTNTHVRTPSFVQQ